MEHDIKKGWVEKYNFNQRSCTTYKILKSLQSLYVLGTVCFVWFSWHALFWLYSYPSHFNLDNHDVNGQFGFNPIPYSILIPAVLQGGVL